MMGRIALLLEAASIRNLCFLFFLVAPALQDNANKSILIVVLFFGHLLTGLIVVLALGERVIRLDSAFKVSGIGLLIVGLIGMFFVSLLVNDPGRLLMPAAYYFKYLKIIFPVICFFIMINIWNLADLSKLYHLLLIGAACSLIFLVPEYFFLSKNHGLLPRLASFHVDANKYALFLNVVYGVTFPLLIMGYLKGAVQKPVIFVLAVVFLQLLLSQSRGGLLTNFIITGICLLPKTARRAFKVASGFLAFGFLLVAVVILSRYYGSNSAQDVSSSDTGRILSYMVGYNIVTTHPIFGIGFARTPDIFLDYGYAQYVILGQAMAIHNVFLEIFAELGIFGLLFAIAVVFVPIYLLVKRIRASSVMGYYPVLELGALAIPIAFLGYGIFSPNFFVENYYWTLMAFTVIVIKSPVVDVDGAKILTPKWS